MGEQKMMERGISMMTAKFNLSFIFSVILVLAVAGSARAQTKPVGPSHDSLPSREKLPAFDVVSIRPSGSRKDAGVKILPDGYQAINMPLETTILLAYFPTPYFKHQSELKNYPSWVESEAYDIDAKVSPADLAEWQRLNQNMMQTPEVLQQMLRAVLMERCKLTLHSVPGQVDGYVLTADKNKPRLEEQSDNKPSTPGMQLLDGGTTVGSIKDGRTVWTFYNTSMAALIGFLSLSAEGPIENKTGLQSKYHFTLTPWNSETDSVDQLASDPDPVVPFDLERVGLKLSRAKVATRMWIVDNIQRPSPN
jgi:uncharacterized protein (TIGR03435 family)